MKKNIRARLVFLPVAIGSLVASLFFATGCSNAIGDSLATIRATESSFLNGYLSSMVSVRGVSGGSYTQYQYDKSGFVHNITAFSIGKNEVTYELWYFVRLWAVKNGYTFANSGCESTSGTAGAEPTESGKVQPVVNINWRDAIVWCNAYSEYSGFKPCYYADRACTVPLRTVDVNQYLTTTEGACDNPYIDRGANGFRLPTEGEWQYAASCGGVYPYNYASGADADVSASSGGADIDGDGDVQYLSDVAWTGADSSGSVHPVGLKAANVWGLYDMSGNVSEWCEDWENPLPVATQTDYACDDTSITVTTDMSSYVSTSSARVFRGGAYDSTGSVFNVSCRCSMTPYYAAGDIGFRVVRRP